MSPANPIIIVVEILRDVWCLLVKPEIEKEAKRREMAEKKARRRAAASIAKYNQMQKKVEALRDAKVKQGQKAAMLQEQRKRREAAWHEWLDAHPELIQEVEPNPYESER